MVNFDLSADGTLLGIEVLGATKFLPAVLLRSAGPPGRPLATSPPRGSVEDVFGDPSLAPLADRLQRRLERMNADGLAVCRADLVESTAWLLAESVLEVFKLEERAEQASAEGDGLPSQGT